MLFAIFVSNIIRFRVELIKAPRMIGTYPCNIVIMVWFYMQIGEWVKGDAQDCIVPIYRSYWNAKSLFLNGALKTEYYYSEHRKYHVRILQAAAAR